MASQYPSLSIRRSMVRELVDPSGIHKAFPPRPYLAGSKIAADCGHLTDAKMVLDGRVCGIHAPKDAMTCLVASRGVDYLNYYQWDWAIGGHHVKVPGDGSLMDWWDKVDVAGLVHSMRWGALAGRIVGQLFIRRVGRT